MSADDVEVGAIGIACHVLDAVFGGDEHRLHQNDLAGLLSSSNSRRASCPWSRQRAEGMAIAKCAVLLTITVREEDR